METDARSMGTSPAPAVQEGYDQSKNITSSSLENTLLFYGVFSLVGRFFGVYTPHMGKKY